MIQPRDSRIARALAFPLVVLGVAVTAASLPATGCAPPGTGAPANLPPLEIDEQASEIDLKFDPPIQAPSSVALTRTAFKDMLNDASGGAAPKARFHVSGTVKGEEGFFAGTNVECSFEGTVRLQVQDRLHTFSGPIQTTGTGLVGCYHSLRAQMFEKALAAPPVRVRFP